MIGSNSHQPSPKSWRQTGEKEKTTHEEESEVECESEEKNRAVLIALALHTHSVFCGPSWARMRPPDYEYSFCVKFSTALHVFVKILAKKLAQAPQLLTNRLHELYYIHALEHMY